MYGIYANIWGILMVNVTIYTIHGSYGYCVLQSLKNIRTGVRDHGLPSDFVPWNGVFGTFPSVFLGTPKA